MTHSAILAFDHVADIYDSTRELPQQIEHFLSVHLRQLCGSNSSALEVGVGTGRIAALLHQLNIDITGVDASESMLRVLARRSTLPRIRADAHALPFKAKAFDIAYMSDVLHLLSNPLLAIKECCRVAMEYFITIAQFIRVRELMSFGTENRDYLGDYSRIAQEHGFDPERIQGLAIPALSILVPPWRTIQSGTTYEIITRHEALRALDTKTFSPQWKIPYETHNSIMQMLKGRDKGRPLEREWRCEISVWRISDLEEYALYRGAL